MLAALNEIEGFKAITVNLCDGLSDTTLDIDVVGNYLQGLISAAASGDLNSPRFRIFLRRKLMAMVFDNVTRYQCRVPLTRAANGFLANFRSLGDLSWLIDNHGDLKNRLIDNGAPPVCFNSSDLSLEPTGDECRQLAATMNDVCARDDHFYVALDASSGTRKRLVWFTDGDHLSRELGELPIVGSDEYAFQLRNWLGLGQVKSGTHLFGFVSDKEGARDLALARPTVFDGIDHLWFKHLRGAAASDDVAGRALNLDSLRQSAAPFDGGWEAVAPGPKFKGLFHCVYVGRIVPPFGLTDDEYKAEKVLDALIAQCVRIANLRRRFFTTSVVYRAEFHVSSLHDFVEIVREWQLADFVSWLSTGLFDLASPSSEATPFDPLLLAPNHEPLGQVQNATEKMPGRI